MIIFPVKDDRQEAGFRIPSRLVKSVIEVKMLGAFALRMDAGETYDIRVTICSAVLLSTMAVKACAPENTSQLQFAFFPFDSAVHDAALSFCFCASSFSSLR